MIMTQRKQRHGRLMAAAAALATVTAASAQTFTEWHDLEVNEVNRYPAHTEVMSSTAKTLSLEGQWKFKWVENASFRKVI